MYDPKRIYECLLDYSNSTDTIERLSIGLVWTVCQARGEQLTASGLAMSPQVATRTLSWPGTLVGKPLKDIGAWILDWEPYKATVGMAALNCSLNLNRSMPQGTVLEALPGKANLTVFEHFLPMTKGQKVVVIGHYPGIEYYVEQYGWQVLERSPQAGDYPDPAAEYLLPEADWVFLSATTLINKTFPRLAELSILAKTVLMGPTVPWMPELHRFGIDYLAGVDVIAPDALYQTAAEGGGVRIFETGVRYKIVELNPELSLGWLKKQMAETHLEKTQLTQQMDSWYSEGNLKRFPDYAKLNDANLRLSRMDTAYKILWDQQPVKTHV